jgi:hypothetical protein
MTAIVLPQPAESESAHGRIRMAVVIVLGVWFLLVVSLGAAGKFVASAGTPPVPIGIGVAAPLLIFLAWMRLSPSFLDFVLSFDLRLIAAMQAWRWAGMGFLSLYAHGVLPAVFAFPAGLGDMAVGVTAPWVMLALLRRPGFAASGAFIRWNLFGILDLVVAVTIGALSTLFATGTPGEISTAPMALLPLLLIPAFLVPLFLMMHIAALLQSRQLIRNRATGGLAIMAT